MVAAIVIVIVLVLMWAHAGTNESPKCAEVGGWPWLGCLMAARENLAGGLIGAGGALFAAWLAWRALREQIRSERARHRDNEIRIKTQKISEISAEISTLEQTKEYVEKAFDAFRAVKRDEYLSTLMNLYREGGLPLHGGGQLHIKVNTCMTALREMGANSPPTQLARIPRNH